jgi:hypothetical protein
MNGTVHGVATSVASVPPATAINVRAVACLAVFHASAPKGSPPMERSRAAKRYTYPDMENARAQHASIPAGATPRHSAEVATVAATTCRAQGPCRHPFKAFADSSPSQDANQRSGVQQSDELSEQDSKTRYTCN